MTRLFDVDESFLLTSLALVKCFGFGLFEKYELVGERRSILKSALGLELLLGLGLLLCARLGLIYHLDLASRRSARSSW